MSATVIARAPSRATVTPLLAVLWTFIAGAVVVAQGDSRPETVLMGVILGSFVLALRHPAWALAPIMVTQASVIHVRFEMLSMGLIFIAVLGATFLSSAAVLRESWLRNRENRRVLLPAIAYVVLATLMSLVHSDSEYALKYLRWQVVGLLALVVVGSVLHERRDVERVAAVALGMGFLSAIAAIWQHRDWGGAIYAIPSVPASYGGRSIGLVSNPVVLAVQLAWLLVPVLGLLAAGSLRRPGTRTLLSAAALVIFVALFYTRTRSALLAIGVGLVVIGLGLRGRRRAGVLGVLAASAVLFLLLSNTGLIPARYYAGAEDDPSAAGHEALLQVGLAMAMDNAVTGLGHDKFEQLSENYAGVVNPEVAEAGGALVVGRQRVHNDFLNVWLSWGIAALVAYLALFVGALLNYIRAMRSKDPRIRGLAIGCAAGIVAYGVGSAFHNYLDSNIILWIYAGLSTVLARLSDKSSATWDGRKTIAVRRLAVHSARPGAFRRGSIHCGRQGREPGA